MRIGLDVRPLRLALWTPVPPQESGISDYSLELLRALRGSAEIEVFVDDGVLPVAEVTDLAPVRIFSAFARRHRTRPFDAVLYQLGASYFHLYMDEALRHPPDPPVPVIVTLHDLTWGALLYREAALWGREGELRISLAASEGEGAAAEYTQLAAGDPATLPERTEDFLNRHLLLGGVIAASQAQIVHLPRAAADLAARYPAARVFEFPMGVEDPRRSLPRAGAAAAPEGAFRIGAFGVADPVKRLDVVVRALARVAAELPEADPVLLVVGGFHDPEYRRRLEALAGELGVAGRVRFLGRTAQEEFDLTLLDCDAVVNLRYPFRHQMSAILMRALAAGKPVLISDVPAWDHFPASFCLRVAPDENEVETLAGHLLELARDPARRRAMGEAARRFWEEQATPARLADGYRGALSAVLGRPVPAGADTLADTLDVASVADLPPIAEEPEPMSEAPSTDDPLPASEAPVPEEPEGPEERLVREPPAAPAPRGASALAEVERLYQRWDALRARSAQEQAGRGPGRAWGFLRRTAARIRDLGISWDLQRDLFRALLDRQIETQQRLGALESGGELEARLAAAEAALGSLDARLAEIPELRTAEGEIRGAINDLRQTLVGLGTTIEEMRAAGWDRNELANLRDRQASLRVRQVRLEGELEEMRLQRAGQPPAVPLTPLDVSQILAAAEQDVPAEERAASVEVSFQDLRAEDLLLAARRHFGGRLSAAGYRGTNSLWLHFDFTADWNRPLLLENAASRLTPGARFVLVTAAAAAGELPRQERLTLEGDRILPLAGGGPVRMVAWRRG